jgi:XRE family transcriptional regulator, regulator of sulfur utilization
MDLGNTIKTIRKQKGYQQNSFAKLCKISQTYLSQIENNQKEPNISILKTICSHLNITLPVLFFLSLDEKDIPEKKQQMFSIIGPTLKTLINELIDD